MKFFGIRSLTHLKPTFFFSSQPIEQLQTQLTKNSLKNCARFENQNRIWTYEEINIHSNAFAWGLTEQGFVPKDKILLWLSNSHTAETVAMQVGAAKIGVELQSIKPKTEDELRKLIQSSNCKCFIFSPNTKLNDQKYADIIKNVFPELEDFGYGKEIFLKKFPKLKFIIHTGFYSIQGTYKFKEILTYASKNFNHLVMPKLLGSEILINHPLSKKYTLASLIQLMQEQRKTLSLSNDDVNMILSDPQHPHAFAAGILNSLVNGNFTVYGGSLSFDEIKNILRFYKSINLLVDSTTIISDIKQLRPEEIKSLKSIQVIDQNQQLKEKLSKALGSAEVKLL